MIWLLSAYLLVGWTAAEFVIWEMRQAPERYVWDERSPAMEWVLAVLLWPVPLLVLVGRGWRRD